MVDLSTSRSDDWTSLNEQLEGSPYLLPNTEQGHRRAEVITQRCRRIESAYEEARATFASSSSEVRERMGDLSTARGVFESNALELTGLSLPVTTEIVTAVRRGDLEAYLTEQAIERDQHLMEVLGLNRANEFAQKLMSNFGGERPITESDIRSIHQLSVGHETFAGSYKTREVEIGGSGHSPHSMVDVPHAMAELIEWLNRQHPNPAIAAAVTHSWLTHIHPFEDGNGRVARLVGTLMLLKHDWPPLVVRGSDREQYLDALGHSDSGGDLLPLLDLFVKSLKTSVRHLADPALAERLITEEISGDAEKRYQFWMHQLDTFINNLRNELADTDIRIDRSVVPSLTTLIQLEDRNPSGNFWLGKARNSARTTDTLVWVGYMSDEMVTHSNAPSPSLFFGVRDHRPDSVNTYFSDYRGGAIAIDEISLIPVPSEHQALIKRNGFVREATLASAAEELATAIRASSALR